MIVNSIFDYDFMITNCSGNMTSKLLSCFPFCQIIFWGIVDIVLSYDVASGSEITPCNKIDKPLVVYRFTGNVVTSITTLSTY